MASENIQHRYLLCSLYCEAMKRKGKEQKMRTTIKSFENILFH